MPTCVPTWRFRNGSAASGWWYTLAFISAAASKRVRPQRWCTSGAVAHAERIGALLLLENLNLEPATAEVHYLGHTVAECRYYFGAITSPHFGWAFTVNHAHLVPEGSDGFLDAFGTARIGEVRLADSLGDRELHLNPGQGNIDFAALFQRWESSGYQHHK